MKPETKVFSSTAEAEDDFFDSYRRVQVISQPLTLFQTNQFPPQRLESFRHFIQLFPGSQPDILPFTTEMKQMRARINEHLSHTQNMPAFSSFSRIKRWQKQLAEESALLCEDIDRLFSTIRDDVESCKLIDYLAKSMSEIANTSIFRVVDLLSLRSSTPSYYLGILRRSTLEYA